jgi:competence protein ComEA
MSKAILEERSKGEFKDWADFQKRVKGVGEKKAAKLSEAGLQVNGKGKEGAAAGVKPDTKTAKAAPGAKEAKAKPAEAKASM